MKEKACEIAARLQLLSVLCHSMSSPPVKIMSSLLDSRLHSTYILKGRQRVPKRGRVHWQGADGEDIQRPPKVIRNGFDSRGFAGP